MKKYIIIAFIIFFSAGTYYVSGFGTTYFNKDIRDTVVSGKSGVSNEEELPELQNPCETKTNECCKCRCKCKCKKECSNKEVPVGENPYQNNPDTATNRIQPQEEK